jgi:hypothetical protein
MIYFLIERRILTEHKLHTPLGERAERGPEQPKAAVSVASSSREATKSQMALEILLLRMRKG